MLHSLLIVFATSAGTTVPAPSAAAADTVDSSAQAPVHPAENTREVGVDPATVSSVDPLARRDRANFSTGFFTEGAVGSFIPVRTLQRVLSPGVVFTGRVGYEFRRWIAIQANATAAMTHYGDGVLRNEILQQFFYLGELRLALPLGRFSIAGLGGAGLMQVSNNLLQIADIARTNRLLSIAWDAGAALDFHSLDNHFSGGVVATYIGMPNLHKAAALTVQIYIRHVF